MLELRRGHLPGNNRRICVIGLLQLRSRHLFLFGRIRLHELRCGLISRHYWEC